MDKEATTVLPAPFDLPEGLRLKTASSGPALVEWSFRCPGHTAEQLLAWVRDHAEKRDWALLARSGARAQGWSVVLARGSARLFASCIAAPKPHDPDPYLCIALEQG